MQPTAIENIFEFLTTRYSSKEVYASMDVYTILKNVEFPIEYTFIEDSTLPVKTIMPKEIWIEEEQQRIKNATFTVDSLKSAYISAILTYEQWHDIMICAKLGIGLLSSVRKRDKAEAKRIIESRIWEKLYFQVLGLTK